MCVRPTVLSRGSVSVAEPWQGKGRSRCSCLEERSLQPLHLKTGRFHPLRLLIIARAVPQAPYRASGLVP